MLAPAFCTKPPAGHCARVQHISTFMSDYFAGADYTAVSGDIVEFNVGDTFQTHTIMINDDMDCEDSPNEEFFSVISLDTGVQHIIIMKPQATVIIDDSKEDECSESRFL